jgi:hypothetical protein
VEFKAEEDADYSIKNMHLVKLYGKPIKSTKQVKTRELRKLVLTYSWVTYMKIYMRRCLEMFSVNLELYYQQKL